LLDNLQTLILSGLKNKIGQM